MALLFDNKGLVSSADREQLLLQSENWFLRVENPQTPQLGFVWLAQGKREDAINYWQRLKNMGHELVLWGNLAVMKNNYSLALDFFDLAEIVNPSLPDPYIKSADLLAKEGRLEEALEAINTAIKLDPTRRMSWYEMGLLQIRLKHWETALDSFEQGLKVELEADGVSSFYYQIGRIYQYSPNLQNADLAKETYEKALSQNDFLLNTLHEANVYYEIGVLLNGRQEWQLATNYFDKAIQIAPQHHWANLGKVMAIWGSGDQAIAVNQIKTFIDQNPNSEDAYKLLGDFYRDLEQNIDARSMYERALELNPNFPGVKALLESLP